MKILLTGATGFLGSHLLPEITKKGYEIIILKRSFSNTWRIEYLLDKVKSYNIDKTDIRTIFENETVDLIIHLATNYGKKGEKVKNIVESNITFPSVLIETALDNGLKAFINTDTSTIDTYSVYSSTKKAFLHILNYFHKEKELKIINLQLEYVYGPKDDDYKFIPYLVKSILNGELMDVSPGNQKRDYIFVEDIVSAYVKAIDLIDNMDNDFLTFEIGSGKSITLKEVASILEKLCSKKANINWGALGYRKNEIFDLTADITKAKELLNWQPKYTLERGLKKTIEWFKRY